LCVVKKDKIYKEILTNLLKINKSKKRNEKENKKPERERKPEKPKIAKENKTMNK